MRTCVAFPGSIVARIPPRSGTVNPCTLSRDVNSSTTGTPFLILISFGEYSNFLAVI